MSPRYTLLVAILLAAGCGISPSASPPPDLLARPEGFLVWDYHSDDGRPGSLFGPGGTVGGRVKVILRWPPYHDLQMVHKGEYEQVKIGMKYDDVRQRIGDLMLDYQFEPDCEYDLCCVQGTRIALFRFKGGVLIHKDQQDIK